jgi:hypothetical protein
MDWGTASNKSDLAVSLLARLRRNFALMLGGALGCATLHGRAFCCVVGQRCGLEEVRPGTIMFSDAAEQVAGDGRQQVVLAKLGDVEQG